MQGCTWGEPHWQLGWRRPRKSLPALISIPSLSFIASVLPFPCCHVAWERIYIFWIGQLVLTPFPVSLAPGLWHSCLISTNGWAISGDYWSLFLSHWPPWLAEAPPCLPPSTWAWHLIAQFNTRTSEYINKTRQALPIFYMASERWIHVFLIMINAAVYYFYCSSSRGFKYHILSRCGTNSLEKRWFLFQAGDSPDHGSSEDLEQLSSWTSSKKV